MKMRLLQLLTLLALLCSVNANGQSYAVRKNLQSEWLAFEDDKFVPFENAASPRSVIHIKLTNPNPEGEYFKVAAPQPVMVYVNNKLVGDYRSHVFSVDSLAGRTAGEFLISVYLRHQEPRTVSTMLLARTSTTASTGPEFLHEKRRPYFFQDFVIVGALILLVMVTMMVRLNPKLASDYFSLPRIFSFREIEEVQIYTRIGSSANILFYVYCSLLLGFYLIVVFHFVSPVYPVGFAFESSSFGGAMLQWIELSSILLGLLLLKIIIVLAFSSLFGISEAAGIHFFNWVRIVVVFLGLLTLFLIIYFIWYGQDLTLLSGMLQLLGWLFAGWIVLIFLKLTSKSGTSMFHLFSYICATELIPFLFIIRVLYK